MMERHFRINMLLAMAYFLLVFLTGCKTKTVTVPEYHTGMW